MAKQKDKQVPALRDDGGITRLHAYALVDPNPQTPYQGTACPVKELKGQREHYGGPPVDRVAEEGDQARDEAFAQSSECQDLVYERTERKVMDVKVAGQAQRCKPRMYRVDTGMKKKPTARRGTRISSPGSSPGRALWPSAWARTDWSPRQPAREPTRRGCFGTGLGRALPAPGCWATGNRSTPVPARNAVSPGSAQATEGQGPGLSSPASPPG